MIRKARSQCPLFFSPYGYTYQAFLCVTYKICETTQFLNALINRIGSFAQKNSYYLGNYCTWVVIAVSSIIMKIKKNRYKILSLQHFILVDKSEHGHNKHARLRVCLAYNKCYGQNQSQQRRVQCAGQLVVQVCFNEKMTIARNESHSHGQQEPDKCNQTEYLM